MPLSVTCQCGARLEIDEKFLGKEIPCPDCQRLLPTTPPSSPPPLDLPENRRVCGWAVLSLTLALVGAFTLIGTLAAVAVGFFALKQIARQPSKLEGVLFARAGIFAGAILTFVTLIALVAPIFYFDPGVALRMLVWAGHTSEPTEDPIRVTASGYDIRIKRPTGGGWALANLPATAGPNVAPDDLLLVNAADDAYIACQNIAVDLDENQEGREKKVLANFYKSGLINLLGRLKGSPLGREGNISDRKAVAGKEKDWQEFTVDLRLSGIDRRFLIQYSTRDVLKATILVGGARRSNFERLQDQFREAFKNFDIK